MLQLQALSSIIEPGRLESELPINAAVAKLELFRELLVEVVLEGSAIQYVIGEHLGLTAALGFVLFNSFLKSEGVLQVLNAWVSRGEGTYDAIARLGLDAQDQGIALVVLLGETA